MSEVYRIRDGHTQPAGNKADVDVVEFLEELLEKAKNGEVVGIACALSYPSPIGTLMPVSSHRAGWACSMAMVGALEEVKFRILSRINGH